MLFSSPDTWLTPVLAVDAVFPRGGGLYFSIIKLILIILFYLLWIHLSWWVDQDAQAVDLPRPLWNSIMLGCGALGLAVVWALPWFWVALVVLLALILVPSLAYVNLRNETVEDPELRVLTWNHICLLLQRYLHLQLGRKEVQAGEKRIPIRFIGKSSNQTRDDTQRVARAQQSKGYKAALEMVYEAIKARATDIHMEPTKSEMAVRLRVDGILQATPPFTRQMGDSVLNIFKVLADLDITEKRKPQDGSFSAQVEDRFVDFRLATAGSVAGEKMVMRILDKTKHLISLTQLGMRDRLREQVHNIASEPHGLLIVCGPTGAGKSTTLYACLNEIDRYQKNVITVENPVEYQIDNVTQIEVNPKAGKTFATELRSILPPGSRCHLHRRNQRSRNR